MKSDYQIHVINKLRNLRQERNMSQAQVAMALGISTGQMGNIESPKAAHKYTLEQIHSVCTLHKVSIRDIFLTEEEKRRPTEEQTELIIKNIIQYER